jgi:hypothetical protein
MTPDKVEPMHVIIRGQGFIGGGPIRVTTAINEKRVGEMLFDQSRPSGQFVFEVPDDALRAGTLRVDFAIADPKSPKELGLSTDTRTIGFGLISLKLEPKAP